MYTMFVKRSTLFADVRSALARKTPSGAACQAVRGAASRKEEQIPPGIETVIQMRGCQSQRGTNPAWD